MRVGDCGFRIWNGIEFRVDWGYVIEQLMDSMLDIDLPFTAYRLPLTLVEDF